MIFRDSFFSVISRFFQLRRSLIFVFVFALTLCTRSEKEFLIKTFPSFKFSPEKLKKKIVAKISKSSPQKVKGGFKFFENDSGFNVSVSQQIISQGEISPRIKSDFEVNFRMDFTFKNGRVFVKVTNLKISTNPRLAKVEEAIKKKFEGSNFHLKEFSFGFLFRPLSFQKTEFFLNKPLSSTVTIKMGYDVLLKRKITYAGEVSDDRVFFVEIEGKDPKSPLKISGFYSIFVSKKENRIKKVEGIVNFEERTTIKEEFVLTRQSYRVEITRIK